MVEHDVHRHRLGDDLRRVVGAVVGDAVPQVVDLGDGVAVGVEVAGRRVVSRAAAVVLEARQDLPVAVVGEGPELGAVLAVSLAEVEPGQALVDVVAGLAAAGGAGALAGDRRERAVIVVVEGVGEVVAVARHLLAQRAAGLVVGRRRRLRAAGGLRHQVARQEGVGRHRSVDRLRCDVADVVVLEARHLHAVGVALALHAAGVVILVGVDRAGFVPLDAVAGVVVGVGVVARALVEEDQPARVVVVVDVIDVELVVVVHLDHVARVVEHVVEVLAAHRIFPAHEAVVRVVAVGDVAHDAA